MAQTLETKASKSDAARAGGVTGHCKSRAPGPESSHRVGRGRCSQPASLSLGDGRCSVSL